MGKKDDEARWTVRGVPQGLQKAAGSAARAEGVTVGAWLSALLARAVADRPPPPTEDWRKAVERRLARLESVLTDEKAAGAARRAASDDGASAPV